MASDSILFASALEVDDHDTGPGHPERPARLVAIERGLSAAKLGELVTTIPSRPPTRDELERVHHDRYLTDLELISAAGGGELDPDTPTSAGSWRTALHSAGLGLAMIDALRGENGRAGFVAPRPPGHHAGAARGMGFCLLNNVAIAARALTAVGERVMILDWDVHHGNGTQDLFWDDPEVLYVSLHESPAYPGTGAASEIGGPAALGLTINVPLPAGATGDVAMLAMDEVVLEPAEAFGPDWVLISAGFDAHRDDPLADLRWTASDYADLTVRVDGLMSRRGRVIAFLEGGYDLDTLGRSAASTIAALGGESYRPEPPSSGGPGEGAVKAAAQTRTARLDAS